MCQSHRFAQHPVLALEIEARASAYSTTELQPSLKPIYNLSGRKGFKCGMGAVIMEHIPSRLEHKLDYTEYKLQGRSSTIKL